jgi:hypothetical protein
MGYLPTKEWMAAQSDLNLRYAGLSLAKRIPLALQLTLDRAIGELQWKMHKSPDFDDSGSVTRVLHDLMAAREGLDLLTRRTRARGAERSP